MARKVRKAKAPTPSEHSVEKRGKNTLEALDCEVVKVGYEGWPDRLVLWAPDRHVWWETKKAGGTLTASQAIRLAKLKLRGETVFVGDEAELVTWVKEQRVRLGHP